MKKGAASRSAVLIGEKVMLNLPVQEFLHRLCWNHSHSVPSSLYFLDVLTYSDCVVFEPCLRGFCCMLGGRCCWKRNPLPSCASLADRFRLFFHSGDVFCIRVSLCLYKPSRTCCRKIMCYVCCSPHVSFSLMTKKLHVCLQRPSSSWPWNRSLSRSTSLCTWTQIHWDHRVPDLFRTETFT